MAVIRTPIRIFDNPDKRGGVSREIPAPRLSALLLSSLAQDSDFA